MTTGGALDGHVAIVTGASRGIGAAVARRFGAEGAAVAVSARTESESDARLPGTIHETADAIRAAGGQALAYAPICPRLTIAAVWWRRRSPSGADRRAR